MFFGHIYRNTPHASTQEKPSFLLFGMDLRAPSQAALFPPSPCEPTTVEDYREELITSLSSARELAAKSLRTAQEKSKERFDATASVRNFRRGDWVLVRFPSDETGKHRKLSQPWHGPYRVLEQTDTTVRVEKVYRTQNAPLHVNQNRVKFWPQDFPPGYYWYGWRQCCPGKVPQWVESDSRADEDLGQSLDDDTEQRESMSQPSPADRTDHMPSQFRAARVTRVVL